ncbi:YvcK family protein [Candidatus Nomurabacteria bacterium]|nr:YvcK family protein [Candidatus Nomurabacteria bacterium]
MSDKQSIVVVGGGTGAYTLLSGLKEYQDTIDITAIINMSDSGGSTGRLRDQFGQLPVGDVRMALAALADENTEHAGLLRQLFMYRFAQGDGLSGHSFGNLFLTALTDILGSEAEAVAAAGELLNVSGRVVPVTADNVHLVATYDDGVTITGEHAIDAPAEDRTGRRIVELRTEPAGRLSAEADKALRNADVIVIGPGDLYSSLLANIVIDGFAEAVARSRGRVVYVANLMERIGQTEGMSVTDCTNEIGRYLGVNPDIVLLNQAALPAAVVKHYRESEGTKPVLDDSEKLASRIVRADIVRGERAASVAGDEVQRSLIRHEPKALAVAIVGLLEDSKLAAKRAM